MASIEGQRTDSLSIGYLLETLAAWVVTLLNVE